MLIVFTHEQFIANEASLINSLFSAGLECLHFRKPSSSEAECKALLQQIEHQYHDRIMLHQHHHLVEEFACYGIHLKEKKREELSTHLVPYVRNTQEKGFKVSSGFHHQKELKQHLSLFDYTFLSPVFDSISKKKYFGKEESVTHLNSNNIIALGGINDKNIKKVNKLGYNGAALLGSIWNNSDPITQFKHIQTIYSK